MYTDDIADMEAFALAPDAAAREACISKRSLPGTKSYYFGKILLLQQSFGGDDESVAEMKKLLADWRAKLPQCELYRSMEARVNVIAMGLRNESKDRKEAEAWFKRTAGLHFGHTKKDPVVPAASGTRASKARLPTKLSDDAICWKKHMLPMLSGGSFPFSKAGARSLSADTVQTLLERIESIKKYPNEMKGQNKRKAHAWNAFVQNLVAHDTPQLIDILEKDIRIDEANRRPANRNENERYFRWGFRPVHSALCSDQLRELGTRVQELWNLPDFVTAVLNRIQITESLLPHSDYEKILGHLNELGSIVSGLSPLFDGAKLLLHYNKLVMLRKAQASAELQANELQKIVERFYPKVEEKSPIIAPAWTHQRILQKSLRGIPDAKQAVNPSMLRSLVETSVHDLLASDPVARKRMSIDKCLDAVSKRIHSAVLHRWEAEAQLLNRYTALKDEDRSKYVLALGGEDAIASLCDRLELTIADSNRAYYEPDDDVELLFHTKNIESVTVKVFEINTTSYYAAKKREISLDIDLDGLVASNVRTIDAISAASVERKYHRLTLDDVSSAGRGVYVVELIGGGLSSRALIRKGHLRIVERVGISGHTFCVLDEANVPVDRESISLSIGGKKYTQEANSDDFCIPFANFDASKPVVATVASKDASWSFSSISQFRHKRESYTFSCGIFIDREHLVAGNRNAKVILKPSLMLHGQIPSSCKILKKAKLVINTTTRDGRANESTASVDLSGMIGQHQFVFDDETQSIDFKVTAEVELADGSVQKVDDSYSTPRLCEIDTLDKTGSVFLTSSPEGEWALSAIGKSGEPIPGVSLQLCITNHLIRTVFSATVFTDSDGLAALGALKNVTKIEVSPSGNLRRNVFHVPQRRVCVPTRLVCLSNPNKVCAEIPVGDECSSGLSRSDASLVRVIRGQSLNVEDKFDCLTLSSDRRRLLVQGLEPGEYALTLKVSGAKVSIGVIEGVRTTIGSVGYISNASRMVSASAKAFPLGISTIDMSSKDSLRIQLFNATPSARIAVVASCFAHNSLHSATQRIPGTQPVNAGDLAPRAPRPEASFHWRKPICRYTSNRKLGDELSYVLRRRALAKDGIRAGCLLERPSLLLNPWAVRSTTTDTQDAQEGEKYNAVFEKIDMARNEAGIVHRKCFGAPGGRGGGGSNAEDTDANLLILKQTSLVLADESPDRNGALEIDWKSRKGHYSVITVIAYDEACVCCEPLLLKRRGEYYDTRIFSGDRQVDRSPTVPPPLHPAKHYAEKQSIDVVQVGEALGGEGSAAKGAATISVNVGTGEFNMFDTLKKAYDYFCATTGNAVLREFSFLLDWPGFTREQKLEKYDSFACHELHYFLHAKDPDFFQSCILPYLKQKKEKRFLDHYFLEDDLRSFLAPYRFACLNAFEKALLVGSSLKERGAMMNLASFLDPRAGKKSKGAGDMKGFFAALKFGANDLGGGISDALNKEKELAAYMMMEECEAFGECAPKCMAAAPPPAAKPAMRSRRSAKMKKKAARPKRPPMEDSDCDDEMEEEEEECIMDGMRLDLDLDRRSRLKGRVAFKPASKTEEFAEHNWYKTLRRNEGPGIVPANEFWASFAKHRAAEQASFVSKHLISCTESFSSMILALAVTDLPFTLSQQHDVSFDEGKMNLESAHPLVVLQQAIAVCENISANENQSILLGTSYFDPKQRYTTDQDGNRVERAVRVDGFTLGKTYGYQVVCTNISGVARPLHMLMQIPQGSVPVSNSKYTFSERFQLSAYTSKVFQIHFYFPYTGKFNHFPAHVSSKDNYLASADSATLSVVEPNEVSVDIDRRSWEFIAARGSLEDIVGHIRDPAVDAKSLDLSRILWRCRESASFELIASALDSRFVLPGSSPQAKAVFAYAFMHRSAQWMSRALECFDNVRNQLGRAFVSRFVKVDPAIHKAYEHLEYAPLVNARTHVLGKRRKIMNRDFRDHYKLFLKDLSFIAAGLSPKDALAVVTYFLAQDRCDEAKSLFQTIKRGDCPALQYDYISCYIALSFADASDDVLSLAKSYSEYPIKRWRRRFAEVAEQIEESRSADAMDTLASSSSHPCDKASFHAQAYGATQIQIQQTQNKSATIRLFQMDVELGFSSSPFRAASSMGSFAFIKPNHTFAVSFEETETNKIVDLVGQKNCFVEIIAQPSGLSSSFPFFSSSLEVRISEASGQLKVTCGEVPVPKAYVKVYSRNKGTEAAVFYKDGYTSIAGKFDYVSLSTDHLKHVERFAILVMSEEHGTVVREASPPDL